MVPDKFIRIDLHGIDVLESQGEEIPGLYNELVESIQLCRYQIIYNWKFNGILISPTYVELHLTEDGVKINRYITVTSDDIVHIYSLESPPVIDSISISENGEYIASGDVDGYSPVIVDISPNLAQLTITENGEYLPASGYDGFSKVIASVPPVLSWPSVSEAINDSKCVVKLIETLPYEVPYVSQNIATFYSAYARTPKPSGMVSEHIYVAGDINKTISELGLTFVGELEYYGNVYGYSDLISNCGLVLLGDFSQNSSVGPFTLSDSISNYSGVVLNGIYQQNRTSVYNTSMLYFPVNLGVGYWAGMKDRNHSYDCFVTFDTNTQVTLSGNKQVIIYGIP